MWLALVLACTRPCEDDELSANGTCTPYTAGTPVSAAGIWRPAPGTAWQIQYSGTLETALAVEVYNVDLFDTTDAELSALSARGVSVLCYLSAGSYEDWRPDADDFPEEALGEPLEGWAGEWWLDIRLSAVRDIMAARLDRAVARGCTGVDPDNVNGWENPTGFPLTPADQLDYNRFIADEAHRRGLSVGLKNDQRQAEALSAWFDWAVNESCLLYDECDPYSVFTESGQAVFHIEYVDDWSDAPALADVICGEGPALDTLIKTWDLDAHRLACPAR